MFTKLAHILFCVLLTAAVDLSGAFAARPLVSSNPHAKDLPSGTPPLAGIAAIPCTTANAYHVSSSTEVSNALGYPSYDKPKILSDDAGQVSANQAKTWISDTCTAGEHYEHYDRALSNAATSGVIIDSLADFPAASKNVLNYIKNVSCVSDLAPGGQLSRSSTEFH